MSVIFCTLIKFVPTNPLKKPLYISRGNITGIMENTPTTTKIFTADGRETVVYGSLLETIKRITEAKGWY